MRVFLATTKLGRPFAGPPGMPKDRLDVFKKGLAKTLEDPEFLAEAKKLQMDIGPLSGEEVERLLRDTLNQTPEVVNLFNAMFKGP